MLSISCSVETKACKARRARWIKGDRWTHAELSQCSGKHQPETKGDSHHERVFPLLTADIKVHPKGWDKICHPKVAGNHS